MSATSQAAGRHTSRAHTSKLIFEHTQVGGLLPSELLVRMWNENVPVDDECCILFVKHSFSDLVILVGKESELIVLV